MHKEAGGEILGGLAGLLARPFAGAAGSAAVRNKIVGGVTRHVNEPLERLLHRIGAGKAIEGGAHAAAYLGGAPSAIRTPWAKEKATNVLSAIAQHPDAAVFNAATTYALPIPGITEAYLGSKGLLTKALDKAMPRSLPAAPVARTPLPAEPTYLREFPKTGDWKKHLFRALEYPVPGITEAFRGRNAARAAQGLEGVNALGLSLGLKTPKLPMKVGVAYEAGQKEAVTKYAVTLLELGVLGVPVGAALGAGVGALSAHKGERARGALRGGLFGGGIGALPLLGMGGALGHAAIQDARR